ncbi:MAG: thiolase family protein [Chloroflexota bacterium]
MGDFFRKYAIVGVGTTKAIGSLPGYSSMSIWTEAAKAAIEDAGIKASDIDGVITKSERIYTHHQRLAQLLGINTRFGETIASGGATVGKMVAMACMAIDAGLCTTVLIGNGELERQPARGGRMGGQGAMGAEFGHMGTSGEHGFGLRRYMSQYRITPEQLGAISVQFRDYASRNPIAQQRQPITLEDYLNSRWVVEPFRLLDICQVSDGCGCIIVTSAERARELAQDPVHILSFAQANNSRGWWADNNMLELGGKRSAVEAFQRAGVGPNDVNVMGIYDCFTYIVMITMEDYGFCQKGEGGAFAASGALGPKGKIPTNTAGGQLSEGHTEGSTILVELVRQLRHELPADRQIPGVQVGLMSGHGGNTVNHSTVILAR